MVSRERLFTPEELEDMGKLTLDSVIEAIDAGDSEKARKLSRRMYREFLSMHDLFRDWITGLLTFIGERYGNETLYQALRESCAAWIKPLLELYAGADARRKAQMMAAGYRGHLQPLIVEEDDEKITLILQTCGSGGRLVKEGGYAPPRDFMSIQRAQPMTYGQKNYPVYCAHCSFQETVPIELTGAPLFITFPPDKVGEGPCKVCLYKDPQAVPPELYARVGKKKE